MIVISRDIRPVFYSLLRHLVAVNCIVKFPATLGIIPRASITFKKFELRYDAGSNNYSLLYRKNKYSKYSNVSTYTTRSSKNGKHKKHNFQYLNCTYINVV